MGAMAENDGLQGFGIKNAFCFVIRRHSGRAHENKEQTENENEPVMHHPDRISLSYKIYSVLRLPLF